ncbi:DNA-3-methyladenine glycosylase III [Desulfosoma caldarium]|uniref:DNA-3-methyladenine glycosylase III n=2 Tax=Desulfosoma caldarium TaxID=610254 RepID=A0A3N1UXZ1_9BACT|nr:DNA-3-methyladenine glycosylase III [Desulfosoma caldarium]
MRGVHSWSELAVMRPQPALILRRLFETLLAAFGPQGWWPADTAFEVIVGAILTQNTAWNNVTLAIERLKAKDLLNPQKILSTDPENLRECLRPSGFFNQKARYLLAFCRHLQSHHAGNLSAFLAQDMAALRQELLGIPGIGPETADSIILYAAHQPSFVVDAYTRRILANHGLVPSTIGYEALRHYFMDALPADVYLFQEFHALLVRVGHLYCRKKPRCEPCPVNAAWLDEPMETRSLP